MTSDYDPKTAIRSVDPDRWLEFDGPRFMGLQRDEKTWLHHFTEIQLPDLIDPRIHNMFETALGAMIYSYFYYPLATLGIEHCFRILELAVRIKADDENGKRSYQNNIKRLERSSHISPDIAQRLDAARSLRNSACHPDGKFLMDPGAALTQLRTTAEIIGQLVDTNVDNL